MYKKHLIFFTLLIVVGAFCIALLIGRVSEEDQSVYEALVASSTVADRANLNVSKHQREGVCKEIWYQDTSALYFRVESDSSDLLVYPQDKTMVLVEELQNVRCVMQEELYYEEGRPMQLVRYMEADQARYNYNTQLFVAQDAKLWRYRLEGHAPLLEFKEEPPLMKGTAHTVEFTIKGKKLNFQAHQFKGWLR